MLASALASLTAPDPASGSSTPEPFAFFDREQSSWRTSQDSLLPDSDSSWPTWPKRGTTHGGRAYEAPTSALLTSESESSSLLPTPVARDDQKQPAAHLAKKVASGAGEVITSLTVMSRQYAATGGWSNRLLPTPTTDDANNTTRDSGEFQSLARTAHRLLPTPQAADGDGGRMETGAMGRGGTRPSGAKATLPLPTAVTMRETLTETPFSGASTSPPSDSGNDSPVPLPGQLTIGDD